MLRNTLLALALLPLAAVASPPTLSDTSIATATALRERALAANPAYAIVESLTTEIGPRMPGTEADARAVEWAVKRMKSLGYDRVWTEPVTFPLWQRRSERAEVLGANAQPLRVTALGGSIGTGAQPLEAEVVGFESLDAMKAQPPGSLDGRIAYIAYRMQRARDGSGYGDAVDARSKGASEAARLGAVALLIRSIGTDSHRFPHTGNLRYADDAPQIPAAALSNPDADQLSRLLARGPVRLRLALDVGTVGSYTSHNVIGEIRGREAPDDIVVIGAHLDSWDLGTGAIDDGAGIGITFAAGAAIAALEQRPRRSIRVIAFANEEQGLLGAKAYAADNAALMDRHVIGAESDFGAGRIYALRAGIDEDAVPAMQRIADVLAPLGIELQRGKDVGGPGPDIIPLDEAGVAWAQLAQDGSDYFDYHHTEDDTLDKIDPAALDQQVAAYAVLAWLAADSEGVFRRRVVK